MADITAAMVKDLRERTGAGMMECKKALVEANGVMETAEDIIAKSGHRKAAKTASRTAAQGKIVIAGSDKACALLEVNCETDFVARDENFSNFCDEVAKIAVETNTSEVDALLALPGAGHATIEAARQALIARIGENIQIRRMALFQATGNDLIGRYLHQTRIGVLVVLDGGNEALAKDLAMHIAAMKPQFMTPEQVPEDIIARQKAIFVDIAKQSGKPDNIAEKMVQGQLQKHLAEICLTGQPFFKDPDQTIGALLKANKATIKQMIRFEVGEGIEVIKKSFDEEVAEVRGSQ
jgi:elongation factor Ts